MLASFLGHGDRFSDFGLTIHPVQLSGSTSVLTGSTLDKLQRTYAWGVDIAGSLADAGGVGALLQFANSATGTAYLPSYDGNGNVASLINLGTGALAAAYEYSPYWEMLRDEILDNAVSGYSFKFSSKWRDAETGWMNYGRRYYDPRNGRFVGRDPIAEEGGINLYAFCLNSPVDRWDRLGMDPEMSFDGANDEQTSTPSAGSFGFEANEYLDALQELEALMSGVDTSFNDEFLEWNDYYADLFFATSESPNNESTETPEPYDECDDPMCEHILETLGGDITPSSTSTLPRAPNSGGPRSSVFPFDHITVATVGFVTSLVTPLTASQNTDSFINWVGLKNTGDLQAAKLTGQMLSLVGVFFGAASSAPGPSVQTAPSIPRLSPNFLEPTNPAQNPPTNLPPGFTIRVGGPAPGYDNGYFRIYNPSGQAVDPSTLKPPGDVTKPQFESQTHTPLPPSGGGNGGG